MSQFLKLKLGLPWPRITLREHTGICSTSHLKYKMNNRTASGTLLPNLLIYWPKFGILFGISKFWCLSMFLVVSGRLNRSKNMFSSLRNLPRMILDKIRKHHFFIIFVKMLSSKYHLCPYFSICLFHRFEVWSMQSKLK